MQWHSLQPPAAAPAAPGPPSLRWAHERAPVQRGTLARPLLRQRRSGGGGSGGSGPSDLACRTLDGGRPPLGGLLAFQPGSHGSGGGSGGGPTDLPALGNLGATFGKLRPADGADGVAPLSSSSSSSSLGSSGGGGGGSGGRASLPTETFQQLRQAVLTSLDIADNAEHTVDYEDGGAELREDILLESCPSVKEVGKSVFEVRAWWVCGVRRGRGMS